MHIITEPNLMLNGGEADIRGHLWWRFSDGENCTSVSVCGSVSRR